MSVEEINLYDGEDFDDNDFRVKGKKVRPFYGDESNEKEEKKTEEKKDETMPLIRLEPEDCIFAPVTWPADPTAQETIDAARVALRIRNNKNITEVRLEID